MLILLKKPSDQKETLQKTISDVSLDDSNRVQTKLARKHSRHSSSILGHLQKQGVFQRNQLLRCDPFACLKSASPEIATRAGRIVAARRPGPSRAGRRAPLPTDAHRRKLACPGSPRVNRRDESATGSLCIDRRQPGAGHAPEPATDRRRGLCFGVRRQESQRLARQRQDRPQARHLHNYGESAHPRQSGLARFLLPLARLGA